jgi:hypothetical protein
MGEKSAPLGYVVRDVTGETQVSIRFTLRSHARDFAHQCAMPVRIWRIVAKAKYVKQDVGTDSKVGT